MQLSRNSLFRRDNECANRSLWFVAISVIWASKRGAPTTKTQRDCNRSATQLQHPVSTLRWKQGSPRAETGDPEP